ncbi:hypothetical protein [Massilia litorea]|jgi:hypothetical protein|uniref:Uncharacterized protein n=1 Tax=Massilia litorea TaxID=2769491 RepID=A0A7L9UCR6_9BURK|nr:hypothetical protein [Massilia litorea]QOL52239.1 hypothetical protein LPB04_23815 [Massilia litorea]
MKLTLTYGQDMAVLTLLDPIGLDNTWSCDPNDFLSQGSGKCTQGLGSQLVILANDSGNANVLQILLLNMFNPRAGQSGNDAVASGDGGMVGDMKSVQWAVVSVE